MKKITILFLLAFSANIFAQTWILQTSGTTLPFSSAWAPSATVCWMCGAGTLVKKTTDGGATWANAVGNLAGVDAYDIFAFDQNLCWIGAGDGTVYKTTNGGVNWTFTVPSPTSPFIDGVYFYDVNTGFVFGDPGTSPVTWRYWMTTNGGTTWTDFSTHLPVPGSTEAGWNNGFTTTDTGHVWICSNNSKLYYGSLRGTFTGASVPLDQFGVAMQDNNTGVAICNNQSTEFPNIRTTNGGVTWTNTAFTPAGGLAYGIKTEPTSGSSFYWITGTANIYRSTDNGVNFTAQVTLSAPGNCISMFMAFGGWAGTNTGQIYKYTDPTGVRNINNEVPSNYSLSQNYPNPFNPTTTINFSIPTGSNVSLKIYDMLGNEVMTVVNGFKQAGNYSVSVDASRLSSGVYFYTINANNFKDTKKMLLTK